MSDVHLQTMIIGILLVLILWVLVEIHYVLRAVAINQQTTADQAHTDVQATANMLRGEDAKRQTHNSNTGDSTVNVTQK